MVSSRAAPGGRRPCPRAGLGEAAVDRALSHAGQGHSEAPVPLAVHLTPPVAAAAERAASVCLWVSLPSRVEGRCSVEGKTGWAGAWAKTFLAQAASPLLTCRDEQWPEGLQRVTEGHHRITGLSQIREGPQGHLVQHSSLSLEDCGQFTITELQQGPRAPGGRTEAFTGATIFPCVLFIEGHYLLHSPESQRLNTLGVVSCWQKHSMSVFGGHLPCSDSGA